MKALSAWGALVLILLITLFNAGREIRDEKYSENPTAESQENIRAPASIKSESEKTLSFLKDQERQIRSMQSELHHLKKCWEADSCRVDSSDPKSSHFAAVERITAVLKELREIKRKNTAANFSILAREWIHFPDDHVRSGVLDLLLQELGDELGDEKSDRQTLQAVLEGLRESISAPLIEKAMPILENYARGGFAREVQSFVADSVSTGPIQVSEIMAAQAGRFIDTESVSRFRAISDSLPAHSRSRRNLEASILEFKRRQSGG